MHRASMIVLVLTLNWLGVVKADHTRWLFDAHSHYTQEDHAEFTPEHIVRLLDQAKIERMLVVGRPAQLALELWRTAPDRFIPFLGAYEGERDKQYWPTDMSLPERMRSELETGLYRGIGELHLFAAMKKSPVFRRVLDLAAEFELPVLLHGDAEVVDQAFAWHPRLTILWAHLGTIPKPELVHEMLRKHPQRLYVDTSVRDARFLDEQGRLHPHWRQFFIEHQDRLLAAIDTYATSRWRRLSGVGVEVRSWLEQLPPETASKIAYANARNLFD